VFHRWTRVLPALLTLSSALAADDWAPNLTTEAAWHSNATLADQADDQLDSLQLTADVLAAKRYAFGRDDALHLSGHVAGDWWPRYEALLRGAAGGRAEWRHQFGVNPRAPIVAIEGAADVIEAKERGRRGVFTGITASVRKRLDDLTRAMISHEVTWYDARLGTYDYGASETSIELDRDLSNVMRVTVTARFREGDIVSYASGDRPDLEARATSRLETNTFDRLMTAYRIDAHSWSARASLVRALDDSSAVRVAYEYRATKRGPLSFPDHLLSVAIIHQF
jgi:hypothetical protein